MKTTVLLSLFLMLCLSVCEAQKAFDVAVIGKGQPVFLFPGFGCTGEVWNEVVADLSKEYQCHVFTFAGFGGVPAIEGPWLATIKDQVIAYTRTNKIKKPTLIGHSLGGTLSLWLASLEPMMFKSVIAVDALPASAALMIPNYKGEPIAYDNPQSKMMLAMDSASFAGMNAQSVPFMCKNQEKQKVLINWMNMADRKTYVYGYIDMLNLDLRESLANIKAPVFVLGAANPDRATVEKTYNQQYAKLPPAKIVYAENSAHFIMYDQPKWLMEKIQEYIRQ